MASNQAYQSGQSVLVRVKIGGSAVAFRATVLDFAAAEGQHGRARYLVQPENGSGQAWVTDASLFPAS